MANSTLNSAQFVCLSRCHHSRFLFVNCLLVQLDTVGQWAKIMKPILLEIRTGLHQVHAASVSISIHLDTSLGSLQHPLVSTSPACSACSVIGEPVFHSCHDGQVFHSAVMVGFVCLTVGSTPDTCFGDALHLVRLPGNVRTLALVMILTLLDFLCFFSSI